MRKDGGDSMICMQDMNMLLSYEYVEREQIFASVVCICHTLLAFCCWKKVELYKVRCNFFFLGTFFFFFFTALE